MKLAIWQLNLHDAMMHLTDCTLYAMTWLYLDEIFGNSQNEPVRSSTCQSSQNLLNGCEHTQVV